jgi:XisH protein
MNEIPVSEKALGFWLLGIFMPARDFYHATVRTALVKAGWTITHDPLRLRLRRGKNLFVDLGAEQLIGATQGTTQIAVEIKSFRSASDMKDLEEALGQFILYRQLMARHMPDRRLYLAIPATIQRTVFEEEAGQVLLEDGLVQLLVFDPDQEEIVQWIP